MTRAAAHGWSRRRPHCAGRSGATLTDVFINSFDGLFGVDYFALALSGETRAFHSEVALIW